MADGLLWIAQVLSAGAPVIPLSKKPSLDSHRSKHSRKHSSSASSRSRGSSVSSRESLRSLKGASSRDKAAASARRPSFVSNAGPSKSEIAQTSTGLERSSSLKSTRRKTRLVVARYPKNGEKYKAPPRGTFRSSYAPALRSEAMFQFVSMSTSKIHSSKPNSPMAATSPGNTAGAGMGVDSGDLSSMLAKAVEVDVPAAPKHQHPTMPKTAKQPAIAAATSNEWMPEERFDRPTSTSLGPLTEEQSIALQHLSAQVANMPVLAVSEFDLFSSGRFRRDPLVRETSEVWERSPKAPPPPKVRRWLKEARRRESAYLEEVQESNVNLNQASLKVGLHSV